MRRLLAFTACVLVVLCLASGSALADNAFQDAFVGPNGSGGMVSDNGQIVLSVAGDTYNGPMNIRYTPNTLYSVAPAPADTIWVSSPFNLQFWDTDQGKLISTDKPMTLVVNYSPAQLGGRYESTLRIVRYFDQWETIPSTLDTTRHTLTTQITYGGDYGLLASNVNAPAPAPPAAPAPAPAPAPEPAAAPAPAAAPGPAPAAAPTLPPPPAPEASSTITGRVFFDENGDGVMNGNDFPVVGAGVIATSGDWYSFVRTRADGTYSYTGLAGANYTVNIVVGPEWAYTRPVSVGTTLTGRPESVGRADFGLWYKQQ